MPLIRGSPWSASRSALTRALQQQPGVIRGQLPTRIAVRNKVHVPNFTPRERGRREDTAKLEIETEEKQQSAGGEQQDIDAKQYQRLQEIAMARRPQRRPKTPAQLQREEFERAEDAKFRSRADTTMTDREQDTFERLFKRVQQTKPNPNIVTNESDFQVSYEDVKSAEDAVDLGLGEELEDADLDPKNDPNAVPDVEAYPTPLREMARKAQEQEIKSKHKRSINPATPYGQTLLATRPIYHRLSRATTDAQIWDILENELFSKVRQLNLDAPAKYAVKDQAGSTPSSAPKSKKQTKATSTATTIPSQGVTYPAAVVTQSSGVIDQAPPSLLVFSMVYQRVLFIAAKLLCGRTRYTPLAFALLPTIKALGPSSYAMGASPGLFNELLIHSWRVHNTMTPVLSLLAEMDRMTCPMNAKTLSILNDILLFRTRAEHGEYGSAVRQLEAMPNRKRDGRELLNWKKRIQEQLEQEQKDKLRREEQTRTLREEGVLGDEDVNDLQAASASAP